MSNGSKHKQEAVPREEHVELVHPPQLLRPQPALIRQLQLRAMRAISRSICLKQPRRPVELAEELEALVDDVLEELAVLMLQA